MALRRLQIDRFRCFVRAELELDPRCTLISGDNAAGKTSLIEAVHVLSSGRSFRSSKPESWLQSGAEEFQLVGVVERVEREHTLGLRVGREREIRLDGKAASGFAALAEKLPTQVIDPSSHELLEGGPAERRRFIDWGVFHVEPRFLPAWRRYQRTLAQRNAALKRGQPAELVRLWDAHLVAAGEEVAQYRLEYVERLQPFARAASTALLGVEVSLALRGGWRAEVSLREAMAAAWPQDLRRKASTVGPHRADLDVYVDETLARERVSRGQQKLLACALIVAQLELHVALGLSAPTLLVDDPAAELDVDNLGKLLRLIAKLPIQLIVTALDPTSLEYIQPGRRFHVEQGRVAAML